MTGGKIVLDTFIIELLDRGQVSFYQETPSSKDRKSETALQNTKQALLLQEHQL